MDELQQLLKLLGMRIGNQLDHTRLSQIAGISPSDHQGIFGIPGDDVSDQATPLYAGADKAASNAKKLYFIDNGIASSLANPGDGAMFENAVFNQLRPYGALSYLYKRNRYEIDFVLERSVGDLALEAKLHPVESAKDL